jgi:hypothetical protein
VIGYDQESGFSMRRAHLLLPVIVLWGRVLDMGEDRRPEILPGRYLSSQDRERAEYDFHADGTFTFTRTESAVPTLIDSGLWEYDYDGPEKAVPVPEELEE